MRRPIRASILAASLCITCGDDITGPTQADFEQLCGQDGPVRILPLDPDKRLAVDLPYSLTSEVIGDRHLFNVHVMGETPLLMMRELWSVGPCGEDPTLLADDIALSDFVAEYEPWPELRFVCHLVDQEIIVVDPAGDRPANGVFEVARSCEVQPTETGIVTVLGDPQANIGPLVLQRWPADPFTQSAEQVVLHEAVKARAEPLSLLPHLGYVLDTRDHEVVAVTAADELIAIDLEDFSFSTLATGVREFQMGPSGRWIVWQGVEVTRQTEISTEGPIYVLDRESGESSQVTETALSYTGFTTLWYEQYGLVNLDAPHLSNLYVTLPDLEVIDSIPLSLWYAIDDARILLFHPFTVFNVNTYESTTIYDGWRWERYIYDPEGITLLPKNGGELLRIPYSGDAHVIAKHAVEGWQTNSDGRVVTLSSMSEVDHTGPLVVVDPATLATEQIDQGVHYTSINLDEDDDGLTVSYAVDDQDPDRHGIWLARLPN